MNYKRALRVWGLVLVLSILIVAVYTTTYNISHKNKIKEKLDLTDDEIQSINYKQLIADIKAVEDGRDLKYAKEIKEKDNNSKSANNIAVISTTKYYGDGYTVAFPEATDVCIYEFYTNGRCVYSVVINMWQQPGQRREMTAHVKFTILYTIISIMVIIELILYIKYKKISKNNKNIEDKKTV